MSVFTPRYILVPKGGMKRKMNTRKRKALSPVVASIILIAVTVAVSIAVAAWMGALTFQFTATEQISITNLSFQTGTPGSILVIANNTGTTSVTINEAWVNNVKLNPTFPNSGLILANSGFALNMTTNVVAGYSYQVKLVSSKGNQFLYTATAPT
jgi:flagellin-like protein